jgi:hypothetical protein|tara:strand:- start:1206 stop:1472 length:267 start_codon:yes stop_codon:yes gene_type:complete
LDEHNRIKERERGHQARIIIDSPLWQEAKEIIADELNQAWQNTAMTQADERETIYQMLIASHAVFNHIETVMKTGKMAEMQLEEEHNG